MGRTQISVNGILTVPKHKPDIQSILRTSTTTKIDKTITIRKKIFFTGHVCIRIEYIACSSDHSQPIHFLQAEIPFNGLLLHKFARERFNTCLQTRIRISETEVVNPRMINTIVLLKLCKLKFSRIPKHSQQKCSKPSPGNLCKHIDPHCAPIQGSYYKKPHHNCDCIPHHDDDC
ncbi:DUF3794 domain-containing protein, partial [Sporomusa ovata]